MMNAIVQAKDLHSSIANNSIQQTVIIDCRFYITDPELGYSEYLKGHIPNAIYANLDNDLSGPVDNTTGRHPLPTVKAFRSFLYNNRIHPSFQIFIYDQLGGGIAARLWFMLRQLGFENVSVIDGGIQEWERNGYPLEAKLVDRSRMNKMDLSILPSNWVQGPFKIFSKQEIKNILDSSTDLVDSRSPVRYRGEEELIDSIAGNIPSSKNLFWQSHLDNNLKLLPSEKIISNFHKTINPNTETVFYCGSGVTAAFNLLLYYDLLGKWGGIYVGGWSEWIRP